MTDRERARLIGLLRQAADQLARDAYRNPPECPDCSETPKGSEKTEMAKSYQNDMKSAREDAVRVKSARDDRRDHDRFPPRAL